MSRQPVVRTRKNDPEAVKARILDAAADLFQINGYTATSTAAVREAAQVSGGALHHHYPTKKDLGLAVIRERVGPAVEAAWIEPVEQAPRVTDGIRSAFTTIARDLARQSEVRGCPLNNLALELSFAHPEFRAELAPVFRRWKGALARRLQAEPGTTVPSKALADALATLIVASYSGAMTMAKTSQSAEPVSTVLKTLQQHVSIFQPPAAPARKAHPRRSESRRRKSRSSTSPGRLGP